MKGSPKMPRVEWTDDLDAKLREAVEACLPLRDAFGSVRGWWGAVLGRSGLVTTPDAVRSRWETLERERKEAESEAKAALERATAAACAGPPVAVESGWDRTARLVEEYEATVAERTLDTATESAAMLVGLNRAVDRHTRMLVALCRAWDVPMPMDGDP